MNKIQFTYQRWFLRVFCLLVVISLILLAEYEFVILAKIPHENFWFRGVVMLSCFVITHFYFKVTRNYKCFTNSGAFWVEDEIIFLETRKKTYSLNNIKGLCGTTISFVGYIKSGMLKIDFNHKTLTLVSLSTESIKSFSDSGLYDLFETVLQHNTNLKKVDSLDFFYLLND